MRDAGKASRGLNTIAPALIGLVGVLIGALVTAGVTYLGDRSHRAADKRTAVRLIANEIRQDTNSLTQVARRATLTGGRPPSTDYWLAEASTLARYVSSNQWGLVSAFYTDVLNISPSIPNRRGESVSNATRKYAATVACEGYRAYESLGAVPPIKSVVGMCAH
jgi:hypothetical protein